LQRQPQVQVLLEVVVNLLSHLQGLLVRAVAQDHEVIGIPGVDEVCQPPPPPSGSIPFGQGRIPLHVPIQFMKIDVGQQRTYNAALWCTEGCVLAQLPLHHSCSQELPNQVEEFLVLDTPPKQFDQSSVVDRVERLRMLIPSLKTQL